MIKNISVILLISLVLALGFTENKTVYPETVYTVYLDGEILGMVESNEKFQAYINQKSEEIKEKYQVSKVFGPATLEVAKSVTYNPRLSDYEEIFKKIHQPLTIEGYQITIHADEMLNRFYVNDISIFEESIHNIIGSFVGEENYQLYLTDNQLVIEPVGTRIENIYLENDITYRKMKISTTETIFTSPELLTKQLLFGTIEDQETYIVQAGDTIETVAFEHEISTGEFLISNRNFTNENNLLYEGQEVVIGITDPQISVAVEEFIIEDVTTDYKVEIRHDKTKYIGYTNKIQSGEKGIDRLTRSVKTVNGVVVYSDLLAREEIKPSINEVVVKGEKQGISIASPYTWTWPTARGWRVTSGYEYRINPFTRRRELHQALDIVVGYGTHIYASNSGTVHFAGYSRSYGNYVIINHNNSGNNYTLYAHLASYTVSIGQVVPAGHLIGYMGSTGNSTGPHLHFELWVGEPYAGGYRLNPWSVLR